MERHSRSKIVLSFVMTLLIANTLRTNAQPLRNYGLKVGAALAEQHWNYSATATAAGTVGVPSSSLWGFDAAAFAEFFDVPYFSLLTEVHYAQKGRTVTVHETVRANNQQGYVDLGPRDLPQRLHYLSIPVMAKLRIESEVLTPFVALGLSLEYLVANSSSRQFNKVELAIAVAAGLEMSFGFTPKILAEARYSPSLTKAYETEIVGVNNRVVEFLVGVAF